MLRLLLLFALLIPFAAEAADAPVKFKPRRFFEAAPIPTGIYGGIGTTGTVANANVVAPNAGVNVFAAGMGVKGVAGYQWASPMGGAGSWMPSWGFFEVGFNYNNINGGAQACAPGINCTVGSTWAIEGGAAFGCHWTAPLALIPSLGGIFGTSGSAVPPLPAGVVPVSSMPYCGGWIDANDVSASVGLMQGQAWRVAPAVGIGLLNNVTYQGTPLVIDTRAKWEPPSAGIVLGTSAYGNIGARYLAEVIIRF